MESAQGLGDTSRFLVAARVLSTSIHWSVRLGGSGRAGGDGSDQVSKRRGRKGGREREREREREGERAAAM
jgi:hypothetical protein